MTFRERLCENVGADIDSVLFLPENYFDACIAGYDADAEVFVYYSDKVIECLIRHKNWGYKTAQEYFSYNIARSKGKGYPTYIESTNLTGASYEF